MCSIYIQWAKRFRSSIDSRVLFLQNDRNGSGNPPQRTKASCSVCSGEGILVGVKRPGSEIDHLHLSSVQFENAWNFTSRPLKCLFFFAWRII
jgi:hypothetical protein